MLGLIIDLELKLPDAARHEELRSSIVNTVVTDQFRQPILTEIDYIHFTEIKFLPRLYGHYDFLILSPQGAPWNSYRESRNQALENTANLVRALILEENIPTLGICGGHQFLALTFGGELGFIDKSITDFSGPAYPDNCLSEKGVVTLMTLRDDPIFDGITSNPGQFLAMQNHVEEIKIIPPGFVNLACSRLSHLQLIRLPGKVVYGLAFHPERGWSLEGDAEGILAPTGKRILLNFMKMAYAHKRRCALG
ncbi:MAG: gamma-glutamyl-gamma-aminobutyrate hydrolase family protein [Pseudomonadota bacterium]